MQLFINNLSLSNTYYLSNENLPFVLAFFEDLYVFYDDDQVVPVVFYHSYFENSIC